MKCRTESVYPKHLLADLKPLENLIVAFSQFNNKVLGLISVIKSKVLNLEIEIAFWEIHNLTSQMNGLERRIRGSLSGFLSQEFFKLQERVYWSRYRKDLAALHNKLSNLIRNQKSLRNAVRNEKCFVNLTDLEISEGIQHFLGLGPKFSMHRPPSEKLVFQTISDVECILKGISPLDRDEVRGRCVNIILNSINKDFDRNDKNIWLHKQMNATDKFLKEHSDVIVVRSDKGNAKIK